MGDTLALWTAFCLPDRKGSFPNNGLISPVSGHYALQYTSWRRLRAPHPHNDVWLLRMTQYAIHRSDDKAILWYINGLGVVKRLFVCASVPTKDQNLHLGALRSAGYLGASSLI
jgi:hypothetical protein